VEFIELSDHPFWVGTQAHPEFKSRPDRPHPLFRELISASLQHRVVRLQNSPAVAEPTAAPSISA
jgi:CTP synthase